ncbi:response regulator transcription factor [Microlunatus lacustris]
MTRLGGRCGCGVFVLDGHPLVRQGLVDLVTAAPDLDVVGSAGDVEDALPRIGTTRPRVLLLEARLTQGERIAVGRRIRSEHPEVLCLLLTASDDDEALFTAVMTGAVGYLVERLGGSSLLDGVRAAAAGRLLLDAAVTDRLLDRLHRSGQGGHRGGRLDDREHHVLELIGQGRTDGQIAAELGRSTTEVQGLVTVIHEKLVPARR